MNFQGLYFYTNPSTHITHFLEFCEKKTILLFETSGFLIDYLLTTPTQIGFYDLQTIPFLFPYKGLLANTFQKLKRRKKLIQEISFEYNHAHFTGIINSSDKQIVFSIKTKGKKHIYRVYSSLDKTTSPNPPQFLIGDKVHTITPKGHTYREGSVFRYEWHYLYKEWVYFILENKTKEQPKRYFSWDLKLC